MKMKKLSAILLSTAVLLSVFALGGCKKEPTVREATGDLVQFTDMVENEEYAVMTIKDFGKLKIRFFPEVAPKAVENFITHSKNGYYNGLTFHRVINDFMIQGGDPEGTGRGGESIWGEDFEDEFSQDALNFRGSLSMANGGPGTNGSQFFIVQTKNLAPGYEEAMKEAGYPTEAIEKYKELGGTPHLDFKHTVFGFVFEGMEIVDQIAAVKTDSGDKPVEDVVIEKIEILNYHK